MAQKPVAVGEPIFDEWKKYAVFPRDSETKHRDDVDRQTGSLPSEYGVTLNAWSSFHGYQL